MVKVLTDLNSISGIPATAIALGNFDGVHLGHAELIRRTVDMARDKGIAPAVFTFSNHPQNILSGRPLIRSLLLPDEKLKTIESFGVEYIFSFPFEELFHVMSPEKFIDDLLLERFNAEIVTCGYNYRSGAGASGHSLTLKEYSELRGFDIHVMEPFEVDDSIISSSLIRGLISEGKIDEANKFLGRSYCLSGKIVRGNGNGRDMGFATANIRISDEMTRPALGVYITGCELDGAYLPSVTNVGNRPTIGGDTLFVESHILDIPDEDLYGRDLSVRFLFMIRPERKFDSLDELIRQVNEDRDFSKTCHSQNNMV